MSNTTESNGFAALLPYETFKRLLKARSEGDAEGSARRDAYLSFLEGTMMAALIAHLQQLHSAGRLARMDGYDGRRFTFLDSWNAIQDGATEAHLWRLVSHDLAHQFLFDATYKPEKRVRAGEDFESVAADAWDGLVRSVETCVFEPTEFRSNIECQTTGEALYLGFDNWKPSVWIFAESGLDPVPAGPVEIRGIETVDITFPTGHLLIADWLRIPAFTAASRAKYFKINCERGKREATRWHADELGFAHVFVSNTCPNVIRHDGGFAVGRLAYDEETDDTVTPEGSTDIGYVCTDLWWATIIDRETLLWILSKTMSREAAEAEVADYLRKNDVIQVQVEPGQWRLSFCGNHENFAALADMGRLAPQGIEAYFTLTPRPEFDTAGA